MSYREELSRISPSSIQKRSALQLCNLLIDPKAKNEEPPVEEKNIPAHKRESPCKEMHRIDSQLQKELEQEKKRFLTLERNRLAAIRSRRKKKDELDLLIRSIRQLEKKESILDIAIHTLEEERGRLLDIIPSSHLVHAADPIEPDDLFE